MGLPWVRDLTVYQNQDYSKVLGFANQVTPGSIVGATAFSFAGCTAKMQVRQAQLATSALILALATGSGLTFGTATSLAGVPTGTITVAITNGQAALLPIGDWPFDLFVITGGGLQVPYVKGIFHVPGTVTR